MTSINAMHSSSSANRAIADISPFADIADSIGLPDLAGSTPLEGGGNADGRERASMPSRVALPELLPGNTAGWSGVAIGNAELTAPSYDTKATDIAEATGGLVPAPIAGLDADGWAQANLYDEAAQAAAVPTLMLPLQASDASVSPAVALPDLPTDDLFHNQYHLRNTASGQFDLGIFHGATSVWDEFTGRGVHVGIIDDGIDYNHPDLDGNYDASREIPGISGFHPNSTDRHGTAVAGIIAAERNGTGVVGVAYDAHLTMMPAITSNGATIEQAMANAVNFDVVNNSWGYTSAYYDRLFNPAQNSIYSSMSNLLDNGRGGLGTVFIKSAGNERDDSTIGNTVGSFLTGHWGTIAVAAALRTGVVSPYSTEGAGVLVTAFGGPIPGDVWTTDRTVGGYDPGNYTSSFNGTSAAAPMVTGIVALMLDANPNLGYRDVQTILAATARHTGSGFGQPLSGAERYAWEWNHAGNWNGGGMHFSEDYGYGLVDALAAVRLAESWNQQNTYDNRATASALKNQAGTLPIPDLGTTNLTFSIAGGVAVERVAIDLGISHTYSSDLVIELISPTGTVSQIMNRNFGSTDFPSYTGSYNMTFSSTAFLGENSAGTWTLQIHDVNSLDSGQVTAANLYVIGSNPASDVYVYTEEFSTYANSARQTLGDTDGGTDTVNTSAVFGSVYIDLRAGGISSIDGVSVTTIGETIENASTGDGNDTIIGNGLGNLLNGFRGNDVILGQAGNDILIGGRGIDYLDGGADSDVVKLGGLKGGGHDLFQFGGAVYALDLRDHSFDGIVNVEGFWDQAQAIGIGSVAGFDPLTYAASYNDLSQAFRLDYVSALTHYLSTGFFEGRETSFNVLQYEANYSDIQAAFGANYVGARNHFLTNGVDEHRMADDPLDYIASYSDLIGAFHGGSQASLAAAGLTHYAAAGFTEGRRAGIDFDPWQYLANYGDLRAAFGSNDNAATTQFINSGYFEHRLWENPLDYIASYGDLISAFAGETVDQLRQAGLGHYQSSGFVEGREPGIDFNVDHYLANYADLRAAFADGLGGYLDDAATLHFIQSGYAEGRTDDLLMV